MDDKAKTEKSVAQAKQIVMACKMFAADHGGKFPRGLGALVPDYVSDRTTFISPFAPNTAFGYMYKQGVTDQDAPDTVLLEDKFSSRAHERIVVHVDGTAEVTPMPAR